MTSIAGVEFEDAWPSRIEVQVEGNQVPVIGRSDLLFNKWSTGRPKYQADAPWLESHE